MVGENVGNLSLYMFSILQNSSCDGIPKSIMGCSVLTPAQALKQMDTQIIKVQGMSTVRTWNMCNCRMQQAKVGT